MLIVLMRSGQAITAESEDEGLGTACCNCCFGRGEFCGEDDPNLLAMEIIRPQRPGQRSQDPLGGVLVGADATRSAEAAPTGKFAKLETIKESIKREIVPPAGVKADRSVHLLDRSFRGIEGKDAQGKTLEGPCTLLEPLPRPPASLNVARTLRNNRVAVLSGEAADRRGSCGTRRGIGRRGPGCRTLRRS